MPKTKIPLAALAALYALAASCSSSGNLCNSNGDCRAPEQCVASDGGSACRAPPSLVVDGDEGEGEGEGEGEPSGKLSLARGAFGAARITNGTSFSLRGAVVVTPLNARNGTFQLSPRTIR
jgi:hypothetical protein